MSPVCILNSQVDEPSGSNREIPAAVGLGGATSARPGSRMRPAAVRASTLATFTADQLLLGRRGYRCESRSRQGRGVGYQPQHRPTSTASSFVNDARLCAAWQSSARRPSSLWFASARLPPGSRVFARDGVSASATVDDPTNRSHTDRACHRGCDGHWRTTGQASPRATGFCTSTSIGSRRRRGASPAGLRGLPVVVSGDGNPRRPRQVVATASYEAAFGIRSGCRSLKRCAVVPMPSFCHRIVRTTLRRRGDGCAASFGDGRSLELGRGVPRAAPTIKRHRSL